MTTIITEDLVVPSGTLLESIKGLAPWFPHIDSARIIYIPQTPNERAALVKALNLTPSDRLLIIRESPSAGIEFIGPSVVGLPTFYPIPAASFNENGHKSYTGEKLEHLFYVTKLLQTKIILVIPNTNP